MSKPKHTPVYFVCYDVVWKMSRRRALQFLSACVSGNGSMSLNDYSKPIYRDIYRVDKEFEYHSPPILDWCSWRGYPCYHITDFDKDDYLTVLRSLQAGKSIQTSGGDE